MNDKRKAGLIVAVFFAAILPFLYGNIAVQKGGLMDDAILDPADPARLRDEQVGQLVKQGLKTSDVVSFVIKLETGINPGSLARIKEFSEDAAKAFPEFGLLSLSSVPMYRDTGEELMSKPYINDDIIATINSLDAANGGKEGMEWWKSEVRGDATVYGLLVGRNFDYATVNILLPRGYDEIAVFRRVAEFLEQRPIPAYKWFLKDDIYPSGKYAEITVAGWATARGLMDSALMSEIIRLINGLGIPLAFAASYLFLRSLSQAMIVTAVIFLGFITARGSIGIFQWLALWLGISNFQLYERVYELLVFSANIISGISFAVRRFESYNWTRRSGFGLSTSECWKLSGQDVNGKITVTALIAVLNFATLYQIGIRGIMEVGILSAFSIFFQYLATIFLLPALHQLVGGESVKSSGKIVETISRNLEKLTETVVGWSYDHLRPVFACMNKVLSISSYMSLEFKEQQSLLYGANARGALFLTGASALAVVLLLSLDLTVFSGNSFKLLPVKTRPLEYLPGTIVDKARDVLNKPGGYGFERLTVLIEPADDSGINNPAFIKRASEFQQAVKKLAGVRETNSVIDSLSVRARESFGTTLPESEKQVYSSLKLIGNDLGDLVKEQLWYDKGLVLFVSLPADDSAEMGRLVRSVQSLSASEFNDLRVIPFGKVQIYPEADKYISTGKPLNVLTSFGLVIIVCWLWVLLRNRRHNRRQTGLLKLSGLRTGFAVSIPFVFASSMTVLLMMALRIPLDQATACIMALAINAATDFSIYLIADYQTALQEGMDLGGALKYGLYEKGRIMVTDIILNTLCFLPLVLSSFIPIQRLGWMMAVMLLACGFGSLVLLPAVLPWCVKKA